MKMNKCIELPIYEPIYKTYQYQGSGAAILDIDDPIRNWYLNEAVNLRCNRCFLKGFGSPFIDIINSSLQVNPYIEKTLISTVFLKGCINQVIRNVIDSGYYLYFLGVDDYYVKNKSLYKERHLYHDGLIYGYNLTDRTYCIYAHDSNWLYRKFQTPEICFTNGWKSAIKNNKIVNIYALRSKGENVELSPTKVCANLSEYLNSDLEKYSFSDVGEVKGIVVHTYIAEYVMKLYRGEIPYRFMDWRVFRLIWEHKKVMLERIIKIEETLNFDNKLSEKYRPLVKEADTMRMLYASHHMKRRDSVLPIISEKLLRLQKNEREILTELVEKMGKVLENNAVGISQKQNTK